MSGLLSTTGAVLRLLLFSTLLAATANALSPVGLLWTQPPPTHVQTMAQQQAFETLDLAPLLALSQTASPPLFLLDARAPQHFAQGHIPGAMSLAWVELDIAYPAIELLLPRTASEGLIVIYCSGWQCDSSLELARFLRGQGFANLAIFPGGMAQWRDAGLAEAKGAW